ncbi:hypothetical protein HDV05_006629 [Chytridiales sp. JEL 0842]|nr:hypothetical protein HDV05_006629 [Chytridiales sp. JEL 0842]
MAIGFDGCQQEIWSALSTGSTLVLREEDVFKTLEKVDAVFMTPTGLSQLGNPSQYPKIKTITVGGEPCPNNLKELWALVATFNNFYGPTEVSIMSHAALLTPGDTPTVGKPVTNTVSAILDVNQQMVPIGVVGDLYVGGIGVSTSYVNLPEMNIERYVVIDVNGESIRMFRTGDLCRLLPDGRFDILGRKDDQVKLRGYRIELDEVSGALQKHPYVTAAAVIVKNKTKLVAFVTPVDVPIPEVLSMAIDSLPYYMVPHKIIALDMMPLNVNGKIDRVKLHGFPTDGTSGDSETQLIDDPRSLEGKLAIAWAEVLNISVDRIGRSSSFYELGGDSISAIRLVSVCKRMGLQISTTQILKSPILSFMAGVCSQFSHPSDLGKGYSRVDEVGLTPNQRHVIDSNRDNMDRLHQWYIFIPRENLQLDLLTESLQTIVNRHDMLRSCFRQSADRMWTQRVMAVEECAPANVLLFERATYEMLSDVVSQQQLSLSVEKGVLYSVALINLKNGAQRISIVVHRLIIDPVSWRILLDDLKRLLCREHPIPRSSPFVNGAFELQKKSESFDPSTWDPYIAGQMDWLYNKDGFRTSVAYPEVLSATLSKNAAALLEDANELYRTEIQELILAGLVMAMSECVGKEQDHASLCVTMKGHGRDAWDIGFDVSNTIGLFEVLFPFSFHWARSMSVRDIVLGIRRQLRNVPDNGISYGIIKYLAQESDKNARLKSHSLPALCLDFKGASILQEMAGDNILRIDNAVGLQTKDSEGSTLVVSYDNGELNLSILTSSKNVNLKSLSLWLESWPLKMEELLNHCIDPLQTRPVSVDLYPNIMLNPFLDRFSVEIGLELQRGLGIMGVNPKDIEDIYPLSPMQEVMLEATKLDKQEYWNHSVFDIKGISSIEILKAAWRKVALAHSSLRTRFIETDHGWFQFVSKDDITQWTIEDKAWPSRSSQLNARTKHTSDQDRLKGFSNASPTFVRITAAKLSDGRVRLFITFHHGVLDGWSSQMVLKQYQSILREEENVSESRYVDFIQFFYKQPITENENFWKSRDHWYSKTKFMNAEPRLRKQSSRKMLNLFSKTSDLPKYSSLAGKLEIPNMDDICQNFKVTQNTIIQLCWALTLRHYTNNDYVAFNMITSGRNDYGGTTTIGALLNLMPVQLFLPGDMLLVDSFKSVQDWGLKSLAKDAVLSKMLSRWIYDTVQTEISFVNTQDRGTVTRTLPMRFAKRQDGMVQMNHISSDHCDGMPITIGIIPWTGSTFSADFRYCTADFDQQYIKSLLATFQKVARSISANSKINLKTFVEKLKVKGV